MIHPLRSMQRRLIALSVTAAGLMIVAAGPAGAADNHALRVTLDKAEVVPLAGAASVVLVANPSIADVVLERGRLLFVLGKREGETRLYVYGDNGQRLIERDVVVVPQHERTVTVTRGTRAIHYACDGRCATLRPGPAAADEVAPAAEPALAPGAQPVVTPAAATTPAP